MDTRWTNHKRELLEAWNIPNMKETCQCTNTHLTPLLHVRSSQQIHIHTHTHTHLLFFSTTHRKLMAFFPSLSLLVIPNIKIHPGESGNILTLHWPHGEKRWQWFVFFLKNEPSYSPRVDVQLRKQATHIWKQRGWFQPKILPLASGTVLRNQLTVNTL